MGLDDPETIYLIDFGLSVPYLTPDGSHIVKESLNKFTGNLKFASLNSCRGNNKSRRDDVQSILHLILFLVNKCTLPWCEKLNEFRMQGLEFRDMCIERL